MKICWDNLNKIKLTKHGNFRDIKTNTTLSYIESCKVCNEPYFTSKKRKSDFCSRSCVSINREWSIESRKKLSKSVRGKNNHNYSKKLSKKHKQHISESRKGFVVSDVTKERIRKSVTGCKNPNYKGNVSNKNIPLYDTYAHQIEYAEQVRRNKEYENILEVKCTYCGKWYMPKRTKVQNRIQFLNNRGSGESRFYCSNECKQQCSIFNQKKYPKGYKPYNKERPYQTEWSQMVKEKFNFECEVCGSKYNLIAHHILTVKTHPHLQADVDNGMCLCSECHDKHGHKDECSTGQLSSLVC